MDEFERNQGFKWLGFFCRTVTPRKQSQTYRSHRHLDRRQGREGCSLGQRGEKKIPCENLKLVLRDLLIKHFEVGPKKEALTSA